MVCVGWVVRDEARSLGHHGGVPGSIISPVHEQRDGQAGIDYKIKVLSPTIVPDDELARIRDMDKRHREQMRHFHDDRCELVSHLHRLVDENQRLRQWPGAQSNPGFEF